MAQYHEKMPHPQNSGHRTQSDEETASRLVTTDINLAHGSHYDSHSEERLIRSRQATTLCATCHVPKKLKTLEKDPAVSGTEDALFVTSGIMGNLISVMVHCRFRGSEVLVGDESHMVFYEQGSVAQVSRQILQKCSARSDGRLDLKDLESKIHHGYPGVQFAQTHLLWLENSHNRMGGGDACYPCPMKEVRELADGYGLKIHLDGARLFNAAEALGVEPAEIIQFCDSITLCLSKGLGTPVGSLIGGKAEFISEARQARISFGGGMHQAGVIAAAGLVALKHGKANVKLDNQKARMFAKAVQELACPVCTTDPAVVDSNMVLLTVTAPLSGQDLCDQLSAGDRQTDVVPNDWSDLHQA
ncbi:probable low-specificity L-threonine aldolase 2 [Bufo bufo]|uniref:probable low-specificity L-threonine aldolase 2 n=1 Tax=Bufo bufo TaxID=8384 RepID=UPI001ABDDB6C|nr:probable low-specificity L-threonine aldolase 2 [Bufo bufo]